MNLKEIRHVLHSKPELSNEEYETQKFIINLLSEWGLSPIMVAGTGVLASWNNSIGPYTLFRADMDALPVDEMTGSSFASKIPGKMHACGHDVHMTILLGLIKKVILEQPKQNLLFLFQPAEEAGGGAFRCMEKLDDYPIKEAWALHVTDEYPEGTINTRPGKLFAASCEIYVTFKGRSAHMAVRSEGKDAIVGASSFIKEIYSHEFPGAGFGFGVINGGKLLNIVADNCRLEGTIRANSKEYVDKILNTIEKIAQDVASKYGLEVVVETGTRYPDVKVDEDLYAKLKTGFDVNEIAMKFTAEDFGFISHKYPSMMFWLGTNRGESFGLHNPHFLPHDDVIEKGVEIFWKVITKL